VSSLFHSQAKFIFIGNILFIICCGFYLAWWLLAFKPVSAVTGMKTDWLLIPASVSGLIGVILAMMGIITKIPDKQLLPGSTILIGGIAAFFALLVITVLLFKRPATSELMLIVGWGMLALAEINALYGMGMFSRGLSVGFIITICVAVVASLVCYVLYYRLDSRASYIDGMIPLILAALSMAGISCFMAIPHK